jgi:hypothetical protein
MISEEVYEQAGNPIDELLDTVPNTLAKGIRNPAPAKKDK